MIRYGIGLDDWFARLDIGPSPFCEDCGQTIIPPHDCPSPQPKHRREGGEFIEWNRVPDPWNPETDK
jgi:hypothetical protein